MCAPLPCVHLYDFVRQMYRHVRGEVESGISYLLRKREQDPYRDFLRRYVFEQNPPLGPKRVAPTFRP
jgi:hypothetical protein